MALPPTTTAEEKSLVRTGSVFVIETAAALLTHRNSPCAKSGAFCVQPLGVPPERIAVSNVYVNVPLNADGDVPLSLFLLNIETVAELNPSSPSVPSTPVPLTTIAVENSLVAIESVAVFETAIACLTHKNSPANTSGRF